MGLRYYYRDNNGDIQEAQARVRRMTLAASASAEEGSVGTFELTVDDPDADFDIRGHRRFYIVEDAALGDAYAGTVWSGYTGDRDVIRGPYRNGSSRQWVLHLHDVNTLLDRRINVGNDCDRPAETDLARIEWLRGTTELGGLIVDNTDYIDSTGGVQMDAVNYEGQKVLDVIDDCAQQSGRNYFLFWLGGPDDFYLWYKHSAASNYTNSYRITNDLDDVDSLTVFAPDQAIKLTRSPSRVFSGVFQAYDGGNVYVQRGETSDKFAKRDTTGIGENVKTAAQAKARANRYLRDNKEELDTIAVSVVVDGGRVNGFMQGHRTFIKATHLPGYSTEYKPMRVRDRTVHEIGPDVYELAMNLTGPSLESLGGTADQTDEAVFAVLNRPGTVGQTGAGSELMWGSKGDSPKPGWPTEPTTGLLSILTDPTPPLAPWPYTGIQVDGDGTLERIELMAFAAGIPYQAGSYTVTWSILQNGASIATGTELVTGGLYFWTTLKLVVAENVTVASGDAITASVTSSPPMPYFRVPPGTGSMDERLRIIGGSLT